MLSQNTFKNIAAELGHKLQGAVIQKVRGISGPGLVLRMRGPGKTHTLLLTAAPQLARVHLTKDFPKAGPTFPFADLVRSHLLGARIMEIFWDPEILGVKFSLVGFDQAGSKVGFELILDATRPELSLKIQNVWHSTLEGSGAAPRAAALPRGRWIPPQLWDPDAPSICEAIDQEFALKDQDARKIDASRRIREALKKRAKAIRRRQKKLEAEIVEASKAPEFRRIADLLTANFHLLQRGQTLVEVVDYFDPETRTVEIEIPRTTTPQDHVKKLFKKARKAERSLPVVERKIEDAQLELDELEVLRDREKNALHEDDLLQILDDLKQRGWLKKGKGRGEKAGSKGKEKGAISGIRRFVSLDRLEILVGKSSAGNERLIRTIARGEDIWLHSQDTPGSHVIVRLPRGSTLPQETLLDAATLAAYFSKAKDHEKVSVMYTKRKHVQKPKGAGPGKVICANTSTFYLARDENRLDRLLERKY